MGYSSRLGGWRAKDEREHKTSERHSAWRSCREKVLFNVNVHTTATEGCPSSVSSISTAGWTDTFTVAKCMSHKALASSSVNSMFLQATTQYTTKPVMPSNADKVRPKRKAPSRKSTATGTEATSGSAESSPKRRQTTKAKPGTHPPRIACHLCDRTDVPLMMGGRQCFELSSTSCYLRIPPCQVIAGNASTLAKP